MVTITQLCFTNVMTIKYSLVNNVYNEINIDRKLDAENIIFAEDIVSV